MCGWLQWEERHISFNFDLTRGPIHVEWYKGAVTNLCYNCLDRNIALGRAHSTCFIWEGNEPRALSTAPETPASLSQHISARSAASIVATVRILPAQRITCLDSESFRSNCGGLSATTIYTGAVA